MISAYFTLWFSASMHSCALMFMGLWVGAGAATTRGWFYFGSGWE